MERPMSIVVADESTQTGRDEKHRFKRIERPMSIAVVDEDVPPAPHDAQPVVREDAGDSMRVKHFVESCPHVRDQIIPMNGGRFNMDQYLRVLRAKAELDPSIGMALTVAGQPGIAARAARFTVLG